MLERVQHAFTHFLAKRYNETLKFSYDVDAIAALAPRRESTWRKLSDASFLSDNEKRQALGYCPTAVANEITQGD